MRERRLRVDKINGTWDDFVEPFTYRYNPEGWLTVDAGGDIATYPPGWWAAREYQREIYDEPE